MADVKWPSAWRSVPLWSLFRRVKDVGHPEEEMLSVFRDYGVVRKESRSENFNKTAENRNIYQLIDEGWLIVNRMKAWQGSLGVSAYRGIVSGHYICFEPHHSEDSRFLDYLLRSGPYRRELAQLSRGVRPSQIEIDNYWLRVLSVHLPPFGMQRWIADFLDAETAQIDALISKKIALATSLRERHLTMIFGAVTGADFDVPRRESGVSWIGDLPEHWGTPWLGANYETQLGKMLDANAAAGTDQLPYVRNVNVQWDYIDFSDLATMHFSPADRRRCELREGDLLVCEGGEVGRAAVWPNGVTGVYFQKAIHRVRPRKDGNIRFLLYCLRAAAHLNVFAVEGNQSTFVHLTGEKLREHRFPFPSLEEQATIVRRLDEDRDRTSVLTDALDRQITLLRERRQALITAAVTGEMEIPGVAG
jgi:type I restriction enzyme S subunit